MIEVFRNFPNEKVEEYKIIAFTSDSPEKLLPDYKGRVSFHSVPFPNLYPFIVKLIFYQLYTWVYINFILPSDYKKISIGLSSFKADIINIQFVHRLWEILYFKLNRLNPLKYLYKAILFKYFSFCEAYYYRSDGLKFVFLSQFVANYFYENLHIPSQKGRVAYSGVNLDRFQILNQSRQDLFEDLKVNYPVLKGLDIRRPIYLFVGAYERKGLPEVIEALKNSPNAQLIVVGKPESGKSWQFPETIQTFPISFTKEIVKFYNLADIFVFPTHFEPFGLVVIEAAACGLEVYVSKEMVGASELLQGLPGVHLIDQNHFELDTPRILDLNLRREFREARMKRLSTYDWRQCADIWWEHINS
jgi:glycosyltransferase involved in cell wall biosynthesis